MRDPRRILITGATGGIGSALARAYAAPGRVLLLHGRDEGRLAQLAEECARAGAEVERKCLDVCNVASLRGWLEGLEVDLAIVNAGVSGAARDPWPDIERIVEVNVRAALATVQALLPRMRARGRGQIALMSSLAAYYGVPLTPAYSASKAALKGYGEALRAWLAPEGVEVNVVMPGFVRSPMSDRFPGPKPFLLEPEDAARRIVRGLAANRARIAFPLPLALGAWFLAALPAAISQRIVRGMGFGG
jgi:short-subunit dehydrogenase